jgi:GNAT superfamily N-acetyltransferase
VSITIRRAQPEDCELVMRLVMALAVYEKLEHEVAARPADLERDLFAADPKVFCEIAYWNDQPAGIALWFYTYSTFQGRHGMWLEDLYVEPDMRGRGIGAAVLKTLAQRCVAENLGRLGWFVLDWNQSAIDFYRSLGAVMLGEWEPCRVSGDALRALAER